MAKNDEPEPEDYPDDPENDDQEDDDKENPIAGILDDIIDGE